MIITVFSIGIIIALTSYTLGYLLRGLSPEIAFWSTIGVMSGIGISLSVAVLLPFV